MSARLAAVFVASSVTVTMTVAGLASASAAAAPSAPSAASAVAATVAACPPTVGVRSRQDIDGDAERLPDQVVGVPSGAGAVDIRYDGDTVRQRIGPSYFTGLPAPGTADRFGAALAVGDLDGSGCADLTIGAPGSDGGRGSVVLAMGSPTGIQPNGATRLVGQSVGEHFGASVAVIGSSGADVLVGAPDRTVSGHARAGAVDWYHVSTTGQVSFVQAITQDSPGVPGFAEAGDRFGSVLAPGGYIGDPNEAVGTAVNAGTVTALSLNSLNGTVSNGILLSRNTPGVYGVPEAGDRFGYAMTTQRGDVFVGVPGARVGTAHGAGAVYEISSLVGGYRLTGVFTQNSAGVPGTAEPGDHFGASLALGVFADCGYIVRGDSGEGFTLAIGSPDEDAGVIRDIGTVTLVPVIARSHSQLCDHAYYQGSRGGLGGAAEAGDRLGAALAQVASPFNPENAMGFEAAPDQLQIGVPGEDVGPLVDAGGVILTTLHLSSPAAITATAYSDSSGRTAGESYGAVLGP